tara:strand:- start:253 stop:546 length:294 start_codon:yes stop_codon:yes gene_type:complete
MSFRIVDGSFKWLPAIAGIAKPELIADVAPNAADVFKKDLRVGFMSLLIKIFSMLIVWKGSLERYAPVYHTVKRGAYVVEAGAYYAFHLLLPNDQNA